VAPLPRSTEDCENAAAALLEDASDPSANVQGTWSDLSGSIGTNVWPGEAITIDGVTTIIRELTFTPVSLRSEVFATKLALANEGASPIAIQHRVVAPLSTSARSVAGTVYAPNLSSVQITAVTQAQINIDCGDVEPGAMVEVRTDVDGWGNSAGRVITTANEQITLARSGSSTDEYFLKQVDSGGHYSREMSAVRVSG
jgi:hypothetical protein